MTEDPLFVEKYRPQTVKDCILSPSIKQIFEGFISQSNFPNLLLSGPSGTGKTSIARALCKELEYDFIMINASDERNLDVVRHTIKNFASCVSLKRKPKAIILDEADGLSAAAQGALRGSIEQFPMVRFILTCNFKNKIIEPIQSRLSLVEFSVKTSEKKQLMVDFVKKIIEILKKENVEYDSKVLVELVKRYFPDNRKILNDIQKYSIGGKIDTGILSEAADVDSLIDFIKAADIKSARQWVENNADADPAMLFRQLYQGLYHKVTPKTVPNMIPLIAQYMQWSVNVPDQEINTMALICELMNSLEFQ